MAALDMGRELPDTFQQISGFVQQQVTLLADFSAFLSERASLEREYASKLSLLVKKTRDKRDKRLQELVVGTSPTKALTREVGERSSVQVFVGNFFDAQDGMANAHASLADALDSVAIDLSKTERKEEQVRKRHTAFASRALADREKVYSDRSKSKARYDETCREVEAQRHKREKAESGDKHADRAAKAQTAAEGEMKNAKNAYLISIALANKAKDIYYKRTCVALQNDLQRLWTLATSRLKTRLRRANEHLLTHTDRLNASVSQIESAFTTVSPVDDQRLYVEYNRRHWEAPGDWAFEPCVGFFDTAEMSIEESAARTFLQNRLLRARQKIAEVRPQIEGRKKELQGLSNLRDAYEKQDGVGDPDEVMDNLLDSSRELLVLETNEGCLLAEEAVIVETIGEEHSSARPHQFKPASFTIPTSCDFCNGTIWGISKQGLVCKPCGFTVHSKCELKAPADCGVPGGASAVVIQGSAPQTKQEPSARYSAVESAGGSVNDSRTVSGVSSDQHAPRGKALYAFEATSPFELTMSEGDSIQLLEEDVDGTGWVKVAMDDGRQGLVPASYCDFTTSAYVTTAESSIDDSMASITLSSIPGHGSKTVRALYDFHASDPQEMSLREGDMIQLSDVGTDFGEGWAEGIRSAGHHGGQIGEVGIFPVNYITPDLGQ